MFEEYRFLRYYIPGSLSLIYLFSLILANIDGKIFDLLKNQALISLALGVFALSPAIGYIIYLFYDGILYNRIAKCKERGILSLLDKWAEEEKFPKGEKWEDVKRKELIDFALYSSLKESDFQISDHIVETIRGFWSHVNARLVSAIFVPIASLVFLVILLSLNPPFTFDIFKTVLAFILIEGLSVCIGYPTKRTIKEAFALEEYVVRSREQAVRKYMRLETENKPNCVRLKEEFKKR